MATNNEFWDLFRRLRSEIKKTVPTVQTGTVVALDPSGGAVIRRSGTESCSSTASYREVF